MMSDHLPTCVSNLIQSLYNLPAYGAIMPCAPQQSGELIAIVRGTNNAGMLRQVEVGVGALSQEGLKVETLTA